MVFGDVEDASCGRVLSKDWQELDNVAFDNRGYFLNCCMVLVVRHEVRCDDCDISRCTKLYVKSCGKTTVLPSGYY
jgi:hypothetical protein